MLNGMLISGLLIVTSLGMDPQCLASDSLKFENLSAADQREILNFQVEGAAADWRAEPIYKDVYDTCKNNRRFLKLVEVASRSSLSSTQLLNSNYLMELYGTRFLNYDIYSAIHSGGFYQAIKDCSGNNIYQRDAMLFVFIGGDILGRAIFICFAVALYRVMRGLPWLGWGVRFINEFPIIKKAAVVGIGVYGFRKLVEIYNILDPQKRLAATQGLKTQEIDVDPEHYQMSTLLRNRISLIRERLAREEFRLAYLPKNSLIYSDLEKRIHRHRIDILNMRLAMSSVENQKEIF